MYQTNLQGKVISKVKCNAPKEKKIKEQKEKQGQTRWVSDKQSFERIIDYGQPDPVEPFSMDDIEGINLNCKYLDEHEDGSEYCVHGNELPCVKNGRICEDGQTPKRAGTGKPVQPSNKLA